MCVCVHIRRCGNAEGCALEVVSTYTALRARQAGPTPTLPSLFSSRTFSCSAVSSALPRVVRVSRKGTHFFCNCASCRWHFSCDNGWPAVISDTACADAIDGKPRERQPRSRLRVAARHAAAARARRPAPLPLSVLPTWPGEGTEHSEGVVDTPAVVPSCRGAAVPPCLRFRWRTRPVALLALVCWLLCVCVWSRLFWHQHAPRCCRPSLDPARVLGVGCGMASWSLPAACHYWASSPAPCPASFGRWLWPASWRRLPRDRTVCPRGPHCVRRALRTACVCVA